jgi:glycine/D-amino acid oxidase-like deaminating enzyme
MSNNSANIVICGAGIAGIALAYELAVHRGVRDIVLVERDTPLALTSDKSTECYRNWWPGPDNAMVALMNRSIALIEAVALQSDNRIMLNRRGYLYVTADPARVAELQAAGEQAAQLGAGPLRVHSEAANGGYTPSSAHGWEGQPDGADLILDPQLLRQHFPYLSQATVAVLHARRCGWLSAQQLGMYLLEAAKAHGVTVLRGEVVAVHTPGGRVSGLSIADAQGTLSRIATPCMVNAAGPLLATVGRMLGIELPVFAERHIKLAFNDLRTAMPRHTGLLINADPVRLPWNDDEQAMLRQDSALQHLLDQLPAGAHGRPEGHAGGNMALLLWNYHTTAVAPTFPIRWEEHEPEIVLRGMANMLPALRPYIDQQPRWFVDGGYYLKTRENRPLLGALPVEGTFVLGALSGFGVMAACGAAELVGATILGEQLPDYAAAFSPDRYHDPAYCQRLDTWNDHGQL